MLVNAYRNFDTDLTTEALFRWHSMLMQGRTGLQDIGRFRPGHEPIQIVSGPDYDAEVHYVATPSDRVHFEMERFVECFNGNRKTMSALGRAAIALIYFEAIHPFEDGNGRLGQVIAELSLSQSVGRSVLIALSQAINARRRVHYEELGKGNRTLKIDDWVHYFAATAINAQERARKVVAYVVEKGKFFERFRGKLNERQGKVLVRMFASGPGGFDEGLSAGNYISIAKSTVPTTTRDLNSLVEIGALRKTGQKRHKRYWLVLPGYPDPEV